MIIYDEVIKKLRGKAEKRMNAEYKPKKKKKGNPNTRSKRLKRMKKRMKKIN